jgi:DNA-directed RNA polymerase subunit omega
MVGQDVLLQLAELSREKLEAQPKLFRALVVTLPTIVRGNRALDLHARRKPATNNVGGKTFGVSPGGQGGPSDEHDRSFRATAGRASGEFCRASFPEEFNGNSPLTAHSAGCVLRGFQPTYPPPMRDEYIKDALKAIPDPNILINVVSRRVKQLKRGNRPLVESLEKLTPEDTALREVIDGKISYELA